MFSKLFGLVLVIGSTCCLHKLKTISTESYQPKKVIVKDCATNTYLQSIDFPLSWNFHSISKNWTSGKRILRKSVSNQAPWLIPNQSKVSREVGQQLLKHPIEGQNHIHL